MQPWKPPIRRRLYLMRHGEVEYFDTKGIPQKPETVPLSPEGREQAQAAGSMLASCPFDLAITSGLPRTQQTAELVLSGRTVPLEQDPRWREIETGRFSDWGAVTPQELERLVLGSLPIHLQAGDRFLGGETFAELANRVLPAWSDLLARPHWSAALVVAHGVVNRFLLCHLLGAGLGGIGGLEQDACCMNLIDIDPEGRHLVRLVNATTHNPLKVGMNHSTVEGLYLQVLRNPLLSDKRPSPLEGKNHEL